MVFPLLLLIKIFSPAALFEEYVIENHGNDLIDVLKQVEIEKHYGVVIK